MSNFKTKFTSRLTGVTHSIAKNGDHIYTASFEDGTTHIIRTSGRVYASVAQCHEHYGDGTEFLFSAKLTGPALKRYERKRHLVTVKITDAERERI